MVANNLLTNYALALLYNKTEINTMKTMTITEKRQQILYAILATSEQSTKAEVWFFTEKVDTTKLREILEDHSLWSGYQRYNQLMREQGETDYKNLNEREVQQIKSRLEWLIR